MTRAQRLQQAHAALLLGFADGCRRAKRYDEASEFDSKAFALWPKIDMVIAQEPPLSDVYGAGATYGEFATDDETVKA